MKEPRVVIIGVGSILMTDDGFGVRVIQALEQRFEFPENVLLVDGGVMGFNLLGVLSEADFVIAVDAVKKNGRPGQIYRLAGEEIPERMRAKTSLHQVDFTETLAMCQVLGRMPETVIIGVEPLDVETLGVELTPETAAKVEPAAEMVLEELERLGVPCSRTSAT